MKCTWYCVVFQTASTVKNLSPIVIGCHSCLVACSFHSRKGNTHLMSVHAIRGFVSIKFVILNESISPVVSHPSHHIIVEKGTVFKSELSGIILCPVMRDDDITAHSSGTTKANP